VIARLACWLRGHDWHYHDAWFRYCRRCGVEQGWESSARKPAGGWRAHDGGL